MAGIFAVHEGAELQLDSKPNNNQGTGASMPITAGELLAAVGYMTDITPSGSHLHSWRVALLCDHLAEAILPAGRRDVFYAGLLHDIGAVGAYKHVSRYLSLREQTEDAHIKTHPQRGSSLVHWLPGMTAPAAFVRSHHEWWDGRGYPDCLAGDMIPLGAQIVGVASAADAAGCFVSGSSPRDCLPVLSTLTGYAWSKDLWAALVRATADAEFYRVLRDVESIATEIRTRVNELAPPDDVCNDEGIERILHLVSALVDLKDPSTNGHSLRTARRAEVLAGYMNLPQEMRHLAYRAGLVHDCGRLGVDTHLLNKSGRLTDKEMDLVRKHAQMTIRSLSCIPEASGLVELGEIAGHDHERYDGDGYPDALSADEIPPISRILSVVDAFDSMISSAHYRLLTPKGAVIRIQQSAGTQFDPEVVSAMVEAVRKGVFTDNRAAA